MESEKYFVYNSNNKAEEITKIILTNDEWIIFLKNLSNTTVVNNELNNKLSLRDIEWIDSNKCVPLCNNSDFVRRYEADTRLVSIISENYGETPLRLWFSEKNIFTTLNKTIEDLFPGSLPHEVLDSFYNWWDKLPLDSVPVGNILVTKREESFGAGHLSAWILDNHMPKEEPKIAWQKFLYRLRPWMHSYELIVKWTTESLITNQNGRILPISKIAKTN